MASLLVVIAAYAPPLGGSSTPVALERFCGERLLDRTLSLVRVAVGDTTPVVAARQALEDVYGARLHLTSASGLFAVLREAAGEASPGQVGLAIDPRHPMLAPTTLRTLVASANEGRVVAVGRSSADFAALATPLGVASPAHNATEIIVAPDRELTRVENKSTLVELERQAYLERAYELLAAGLLIRDPPTTRIEGSITFGVDVEIEPGCALHGPIVLGDRVRIGRGCILARVTIANDTEIRPFTIVEDASIGESSFVGPYARVRPGTSVGDQSQIGNFVELKAARLGSGNRINHLSFVGDVSFGDHVTIGAGTITCNHDGARTQLTTIGPGAYVGSGCILVAPVAIGHDATIGAGSTITEDAPASKLTLARIRQVVIEGWPGLAAKRK